MNNPLSGIVNPLLNWYAGHARVLPWREEPTPYRVWISEIMLQQTRVEAAKSYFERFTAELPDITTLAQAPEAQLLKLWEGLGYYSRVRNLHKAAQLVVSDYGGRLPSEPEELIRLPGIGAYTAGAIASIAYGKSSPAVDGNVLRVIARVTASTENISDTAVKRGIEQQLKAIYPAEHAGDFTQALMELGALICLPNGSPKCGDCPLQALCAAHKQGIEEELPVKQAKKARKIEHRTVFLILCREKAAIQKRPDKGLLAGLWEFPSADGVLSPQQTENLLKTWGLVPLNIARLPPSNHIFTHIEWHMNGFLVSVADTSDHVRLVWAQRGELLETYTLPTAFKTFFSRFLEAEE